MHRRTQYSVSDKVEIVTYNKEHTGKTQEFIAAHFTEVWGKPLGRSTVGDILREKAKWENAQQSNTNSMRQRAGKHEKLEESLFIWFTDFRAHNAIITDQMLLEKARLFGAELNIDNDFRYSK